MKTSTTAIIRNKVFEELQYDALSAIVTEALVRATPLNKQELADKTKELHEYVGSTLRGMNAIKLIDTAMEAATDSAKKAYLYNLKDAVTTVPRAAANRIANENVNTDSVQQVVGDRAFTKEELSSLQSKADSLTIPELSKTIQEKVTTVLKDEKEAYEEEQILQHELAQAVQQHTEEVQDTLAALDEPDEDEITDNAQAEETIDTAAKEFDPGTGDEDSDDEDDLDEDESLDSYMNLVLSKSDARSHVSLFSKLQDLAIETMMVGGYNLDSELPMSVVKSMTEHSVFPTVNIAEESVESSIDRLTVAMEAGLPTEVNGDTVKSALACAIIVYTLLETLKTMNLSTPALDSIKSFVGSVPKVSTPADVSNSLQEKLTQQVNSIRDKIPHMNAGQLGIAFDSCVNLRNQINGLGAKYPELKSSVVLSLEGVINTLQAKINEMNKTPAQESAFTQRQKAANAANFSRVASIWGKRTDVREFKINVDPGMESTSISVEVFGENGRPITDSRVNLTRDGISGTLMDVVTEAVDASKMMSTFPAVSIYNTATCKKTQVKPYTY